MSILADILSKVQQPKFKREVAPNLKNIVTASAGLSKKKIIVLSAIFIVSTLSGIFFIRYLNSLSGPDINITSVSPDAVKQRVRARQAAASKSSSPAQTINPVNLDKQNKATEDTQPLMSVNESGGAISEKKPTLPNIISRNEDRVKALQPLADKTDNETLGIGSHKNEVTHVAAMVPEKPANKINTDTPPSPAMKAESPDMHGVDAYLYKAREYETKGDYSKALVNYKKALEMDKNNYAVINNIAFIYLRLNLADESIRYSGMAVEINKDYTPALINLGIAYAKSGDLTNAQERLERAFILEPDNKNVVLNLAVLHERQGRMQEAGEYFSRLVKSEDMDGALGLARVYEKQGRREEAAKLYRSVHDHQSADDRMKSHARKRMIELNNRK
ncbi:MAG: tetratricopeptide repeat protein [Nitrospirae bacterium]|nr:tetratricopeptide repeat protein [Nitrospirota bacterium]